MSMAFPTASAGLQRVLVASFAGLAALLLSGCVNTRTTTTSLDSASSSSGPQLVTESDESNARRRARLRMELAAGYFEHGQNTVALDEIKQAASRAQHRPGSSRRACATLPLSRSLMGVFSLPKGADDSHALGQNGRATCKQSQRPLLCASGLAGRFLAARIPPCASPQGNRHGGPRRLHVDSPPHKTQQAFGSPP